MGGAEEIYQEQQRFKKKEAMKDQWVTMEGGNGLCDSDSIGSSSFFEDSVNSISSSSDMMEDATSSESSSSSSTSHDGPLFELSDLMAQLPIKRGLSKYYQGKSQTFTSLESVKSLEDLAAERRRPKRRKTMESSKSYGGGLDKHIYSPKATISKKSSRVSLVSSIGRKGTTLYSFSSCGTSIPVQKNL